jgi:phosphate starvation-inducible protein PhoH and related proteins
MKTTLNVNVASKKDFPRISNQVKAKNLRQARYIELLKAPHPDIVIGTGPAGCGKTMLSTHIGLQKLQNNEVRKLVLTRPMVSVDETLGILPGGLFEKMEPWIRPFQDILLMHYQKNVIEKMIKDDIIEICPLAIMRGRSLDNAWIICDEAQNTTPNQMMMLLTRIGKNSKIIIAGDPSQHDRGFHNNGLSDILLRLHQLERDEHDEHDEFNEESTLKSWIEVVKFNEEDVERNPIIPKILELYS